MLSISYILNKIYCWMWWNIKLTCTSIRFSRQYSTGKFRQVNLHYSKRFIYSCMVVNKEGSNWFLEGCVHSHVDTHCRFWFCLPTYTLTVLEFWQCVTRKSPNNITFTPRWERVGEGHLSECLQNPLCYYFPLESDVLSSWKWHNLFSSL